MLWLIPAVAAYFFFALSAAFDRFLLVGPLPKPRVYAFAAGVTGIFSLLLAPLGFHIPSAPIIAIAFLAGFCNVTGLWALYTAVRESHVSRIVPMTGALTPIFTAIAAAAIAPTSFTLTIATLDELLFLIGGTALLSMRGAKTEWHIARRDLRNAALASLLFACGTVATKYVFANDTFINGLIWTSLGGFLTSLILLSAPETRRVVAARETWLPKRIFVPLVTGKAVAGIGSLLQQYAISRAAYGQLATLNALQGVQYLFLLLVVSILALRNPKLLREELTPETLPLRIIGTIAVTMGLALAIR